MASLEEKKQGGFILLTWLLGQMNNAMESCAVKSVMSGVMGFGMGGLFGMFMASVRSSPSLPFPSLLRANPHSYPDAIRHPLPHGHLGSTSPGIVITPPPADLRRLPRYGREEL
jgi:hypothetical protein